MAYRQIRNCEASIVDWLTNILTSGGWTGIRVEKVFAEIYKGTLPAICIGIIETRPEKLEIGSKTNLKYYTITIRIFGTSDGIRCDLTDFITDALEDDINYYAYTITNGVVSAKVLTGRIVITRWLDNRKELTNTEGLEKEDRYRSLLSFEAIVAD